MKALFGVLLLIFLFTDLEGQQSIHNWKKHPIPTKEQVLGYNNSDTSWFVSIDSKGDVVAQNKIARFPTVDTLPFKPYFDTIQPYRFRGFRTVKKVENGYLFGFNKGEFGGSLHWFSPTGDSTYKISNGLVNYIFEMKGKTFMASGLLHFGDDGTINQMILIDDKWTIGPGVDLAHNPVVFLPLKDKLLVVTSATILFFEGLKKIKYIKKGGFWDILYPQSAVIKGDDLYVGMRGGVYKISLTSKKEVWLLPDN